MIEKIIRNDMTGKLLIFIIFVLFNSVFAQHDHNTHKNRNSTVLFTTQNEQYTGEVESDAGEFYKDSLYTVNLKLTTSYRIDSSGVKLKVVNDAWTMNEDPMELLNGKYTAQIKFQSEGNHLFEFAFKTINEDSTLKSFSFSFNVNVRKNDRNNMQHSEGMMGMGSTGFWLIMGGIMVAMMAVIMLVNPNK